ncbi:MAG: hypothetical protein WBA45_02370 [Microthrixaceae bacterium]
MSTNREGLSIWTFVAGFLALAVLGIAFLLMVGSPAGDTKPAKSPYWEDDAGADSSTAAKVSERPGKAGETVAVPDTTDPDSDSSATGSGKPATGGSGESASPGDGTGDFSQDATTPVTYPGGQPAPTGVREVLRKDGSISLSFRISEDRLGDSPQALVPPMKTKVPAKGSSITVWVSCARSSRESLAQVSVSETDRMVTVAAVVLVPANAVGCDNSAEPRELTIPLESPVGSRSVTVLPTSTKLPDMKLN